MLKDKPINEYTIFVSVASFNDRWLQQTIDTAINKAAYPQRVYFGIWEHRTDHNFILDSTGNKNIKHAKLTFPGLLGVGVARMNAFSLYDGQDFILQIDAHMIFNDNWDNVLIENYLQVRKDTKNDKIIFSQYIAWWSPQSDGTKYFSAYVAKTIDFLTYNKERDVQEKEETEVLNFLQQPTKNGLFIYQKGDKYKAVSKFWDDIKTSTFLSKDEAIEWLRKINLENEDIPQQQGEGISKDLVHTNYIEHTGFSGHFVFTIPDFIKEVGPDPVMIFMGEEHTTALRAWTRGYRTYGIGDIVMWHLNKDGLVDPEDRINLPIPEHMKTYFFSRNAQAINRSRDILTGKITGYWGAPSKEMLAAYEKASNYNFKKFYNRVDIDEKE